MKKTNDKISDLRIKKKFEKIKEDKYEEMRNFFEQKLNYYNQSSDKYDTVIDDCLDLYMEEINKMVIIYNKLFDNISKIIEEENCRKFEINEDIKSLNEKLEDKLNTEINKIKIIKIIKACDVKVLNYDLLIDYIKKKQREHFESLDKVFNEIFKINFYQIVIFDDSFFGKLKRGFIVFFAGKRKFEKFLKDYNENMLKDFEEGSNKNISRIKKEINKLLDFVEIENQRFQNEYYRMVA